MRGILAMGAVVLIGLIGCSDDGVDPQLDSGPPADTGKLDLGQVDDLGPGEGGALDGAADMSPDGPKAPARWEVIAGVGPSAIGFTATLLNDGRVLVAGGYRKDPLEKYLADTHLFLPSKRIFVAAGKLKEGRAYHTATVLTDGRVLVVGGRDINGKELVTTEIFDPTKPAASAWTSGPSLAAPRRSHAAVRIKSGDVFVAGGYDYSTGTLDSVAIYMAGSNTWKLPASKMTVARNIPMMIRLTNGKVLIVGGAVTSSKDTDTLEIFDPAAGTFVAVKDKLSYARFRPSLSLLKDGRVLIVGGVGFGNKSDEIYDPVADKITPISHPGGPPEEHAAATLKDGRVLICGGDTSTHHNKALIYDPAAGGAWLPQPDMTVGRYRHQAVTLKDGSVLVVGGRKTGVEAYINVAELYVP